VTGPGLRERKKQRTRCALAQAALRLFGERGYEETTIADIAAAADVSTRTFFSYYPSKEHVVFSDAEERATLALAVIAERQAGERPVDLLVRAVREVIGLSCGQLPARAVAERTRLVKSVPALQAHQLRMIHDAQQLLSEALLAAYPSELDTLDARITVSVVMSAVLSASMFALESDQPDDLLWPVTEHAIDLAVHGLGSIGLARGDSREEGR